MISFSFKTLKQDLRDANNEAQRLAKEFGTQSQQFVDAAKRVAQLKDTVSEYSATVEAFNPDNKLQAIVGVAKGAVGAIQGVSGAMAFLGVESETATETMAKLQGLMAFSEALNSVDEIKNSFKNFASVLGLTSNATKGQAVATEGATIATKGLSLALKSIGIGLLISAIAYLVSNWNELKNSFTSTFPALNKLGEYFNNIKQIAFGLGNTIVNFVATPIRTIIRLIQGDLRGAINEVKNGMNVVSNYQKGAAQQADAQRKEETKKIANEAIKRNEDRIKVLKAEGKDTAALERANFTLRKSVLDRNSDEYKSVITDQAVFEAGVRKKNYDDQLKVESAAEQKRKAAAEKAKAERDRKQQEEEQQKKAAIEAAKKLNQDLEKENNLTDAKEGRDRDLAKLQQEYEEKKAILLKGGQDLKELDESIAKERKAITDKYDALDKEKRDKDEAEAKAKREKDLEDARKNRSLSAETTLINTQVDNRILETDTPEQRRTKLDALFSAEQDEKATQFEIELERLAGNEEAIKNLKAKYRADELTSAIELKEAKDKLDEQEREGKINTMLAIGDAAVALGDLFGKQTIASKAINAANALMNTYVGISEVWRSKSVLPEPFATASKVASTIVAATSGFAAVKNILKTQVPGGGGGGGVSAPSASTVTAPVINAASTNTNTTPQDVRVVNNSNSVVKAYITDRDLKDNEEKSNFLKKLQTI